MWLIYLLYFDFYWYLELNENDSSCKSNTQKKDQFHSMRPSICSIFLCKYSAILLLLLFFFFIGSIYVQLNAIDCKDREVNVQYRSESLCCDLELCDNWNVKIENEIKSKITFYKMSKGLSTNENSIWYKNIIFNFQFKFWIHLQCTHTHQKGWKSCAETLMVSNYYCFPFFRTGIVFFF